MKMQLSLVGYEEISEGGANGLQVREPKKFLILSRVEVLYWNTLDFKVEKIR